MPLQLAAEEPRMLVLLADVGPIPAWLNDDPASSAPSCLHLIPGIAINAILVDSVAFLFC
jgi:hypothetical protein